MAALVNFLTRRRALSTVFSTSPKPLSPNYIPQYVLRSEGAHRAGLLRDVSAVVAARGASVAATQKISLGSEYAMLMHICVPDGADDADLEGDLRRAIGASSKLSLSPLDAASRSIYEDRAPPKRGRLQIECAQRPGLVAHITSILGDRRCAIPKMSTRIVQRDDEVVFRLDADIEVPKSDMSLDTLLYQLRGLRELTRDSSLKVNFIESTSTVAFEA